MKVKGKSKEKRKGNRKINKIRKKSGNPQKPCSFAPPVLSNRNRRTAIGTRLLRLPIRLCPAAFPKDRQPDRRAQQVARRPKIHADPLPRERLDGACAARDAQQHIQQLLDDQEQLKAYQLIIAGLARSFNALPVGGGLTLDAELLVTGVSQMFLAALQIAGPLVVVLFLADVGLGLLTRVAPQLNAFALGFPLKILITLTMGTFLYLGLPGVVSSLTDRALDLMGGAAGG